MLHAEKLGGGGGGGGGLKMRLLTTYYKHDEILPGASCIENVGSAACFCLAW